MLKKLFFVCSVALIATMAQASNTVDFEGNIAGQTCNVTVNGSASPVVLLPSMTVTSIENNVWVGETPFHVVLTNCPTSDQDTVIRIQFIPNGPASAVDYMLGNTGSAQGVNLVLLENVGATQALDLFGMNNLVDLGILAAGSNSLTHTFAAAYAKDSSGPVAAGSFRASMQYAVIYP